MRPGVSAGACLTLLALVPVATAHPDHGIGGHAGTGTAVLAVVGLGLLAAWLWYVRAGDR